MFRIYHYEFREAESASAIKQGVTILFAILLSLFLGGVLIRMISKVDPFKAYWSLLYGAFGSKHSISETFVRVIPLMLMGLATTVCFRAQIWNIGGNGQLLAGAVAATVISLYAGFLPPAILIALILPAAAMAGGIWSGIAGFFRARYGLNEIFTTLMMNYIFEFFSIFLLEEVWREATWGMPWTELFPENAWWPVLYPGTKIHIGLIVGIFGVVAINYLLFHTPLGYEIRALGLNPKASAFKGIRVPRTIIRAMFIGGALAGIAGAGQVCGVTQRFVMDINPGYGFTGIIVALMGRLTPVGVVFSAFFVGALINGSYNMETVTGIPNALIDSIQGIILVSVISAQVISTYQIRRVSER
jgi:simple sugar transport system permease protein